MSIEHEVLELALAAPTLDQFRGRALTRLREHLDADVALFVTAVGGRVARASIAMDAIEASLEGGWATFGAEILPVQREALRVGAATDRRVLGNHLERTLLYREIMAPLEGRESLFVVPAFGGHKLGFVMLGRTGRRRFTDAEVGHAARLGPCLAVSCAAIHRGAPAQEPPEIADLTGRKRELLEYIELGYTTREIALACGTSVFTVRNQLSALYRQLGVSNRAEAAGLRARRT